MSNDNHTEWLDTVSDHQPDLLRAFKVDNGQLVVGHADNWISYCSEGGGGAISSPTTKDLVGDIPVYMCIPLPGSNLSHVRRAIMDGSDNTNVTGWFAVMRTISTGSSALPAALLPSQMGAWWWLPLLTSVAMAVVA